MFEAKKNFSDFGSVAKVLCFASPEFTQSLDWSFKRVDLHKNFQTEFVSVSWSDLASVKSADLVICQFDIGQPVPSSHIKKIKDQALAVFIQPTPRQLLEIASLKNWVAMDWEGAGHDKIAQRVLELLQEKEGLGERDVALETLNEWAQHKKNQIREIVWLNAPEKSRAKKFVIPEKQYFFSIGAAQSQADFKLPIEGKDEFIYFQYVSNNWSLKSAAENVKWAFSADAKELRVGDFLKIFDFDFELRTDSTTRELMNIVKLKKPSIEEIEKEGAEGFSDLLKTLLLRQLSGELRVKGGASYGYVYLEEGRVIQAFCGAVNGLKALLRIQEWEESSWIFQPGKKDESSFKRMYLDWKMYREIFERWKVSWARVKNLRPPLNMKLSINPEIFSKIDNWSVDEYRVTSAVSEYVNVRDVLNYCPMLDNEIVTILISLRKRNLLSPLP